MLYYAFSENHEVCRIFAPLGTRGVARNLIWVGINVN